MIFKITEAWTWTLNLQVKYFCWIGSKRVPGFSPFVLQLDEVTDVVGGMLVCGSGQQQEPGHVPQREVVGRKVRLWWRNRRNGYTAGIWTSNLPVRLAWFLPEAESGLGRWTWRTPQNRSVSAYRKEFSSSSESRFWRVVHLIHSHRFWSHCKPVHLTAVAPYRRGGVEETAGGSDWARLQVLIRRVLHHSALSTPGSRTSEVLLGVLVGARFRLPFRPWAGERFWSNRRITF